MYIIKYDICTSHSKCILVTAAFAYFVFVAFCYYFIRFILILSLTSIPNPRDPPSLPLNDGPLYCVEENKLNYVNCYCQLAIKVVVGGGGVRNGERGSWSTWEDYLRCFLCGICTIPNLHRVKEEGGRIVVSHAAVTRVVMQCSFPTNGK